MRCYVTKCFLIYPDFLNIFNKFVEIIACPRLHVGSIQLAFAAVIVPYRLTVCADAFAGNIARGTNPRCGLGRA